MDTTKNTGKESHGNIFKDKSIGMEDPYLLAETICSNPERTKLEAFRLFVHRFQHLDEPNHIYNFIENFHSVIDDENNQFLSILQEFVLASPDNTQKRAQKILKMCNFIYKFMLNQETEYSTLILLNILTNRNMISSFLLDLVIDEISSIKESKYIRQRLEIILNALEQNYPIRLREIGKIEKKIKTIFNTNSDIINLISKIEEKLYSQRQYDETDFLDFISTSNADDLENYSENLWKIGLKNIDQDHLTKKLIENISNGSENTKLKHLIALTEIIKHNTHIISKIIDYDALEIFYNLSNHDSEDIAYISLCILSNFVDCHTRKNKI